MRAVVGVVLLLLAAGLASLGVYLWAWPPAASRPGSGALITPIARDEAGQTAELERRTRELTELLALERRPRSAPGEGAEPAAAAPVTRPANDNVAESNKSKDLEKIVENRRRIEQLPKGNIVLDGPDRMKVSETRAVHANVGVNVPMETLRKGLRPGNQAVEGSLAVSSEMIAVLNGPGFKITATTPEQQSVAEGFPTVWSWNVEANSAGDKELEATLYALVATGDTPSRQRIDSYTHKISVSVMEQTWGDWVKSFRDEIRCDKGHRRNPQRRCDGPRRLARVVF